VGQTLTEKIIQKYALGLQKEYVVKAGDTIWMKPRHVLTHDNTAAIISKFKKLTNKNIINSQQPVIALDHNIQDQSKINKKKYDMIRQFALKQKSFFFHPGRGIGHQIMIEEGFAFPGTFCVASDSHANIYGGIGCLGTPVVRSDAACIWATGKMWWIVPQVISVQLKNKLKPGLSGKDIILALIAKIGTKEVLNCALEFSGDGVEYLGIDERLAIANMSTEWGALTGLFPIDKKVIDWMLRQHNRFPDNENFSLERIASLDLQDLSPDSDAYFYKTISVDLDSIGASITVSNSLRSIMSKNKIEKKIKIDKAYLVSCVNSRTTDLEKAAKVLRGNNIHKNVELYISAASTEVLKDLKESGYWDVFIDLGAKILPPGCGPCIGLGEGLLKDGEVAVSSTNRNFPGRMGSVNSQVYLSSPKVVAESAIKGFITAKGIKDGINYYVKKHSTRSHDFVFNKHNMIDECSKSTLLFCPSNNISTDAIYPSKYTYNESLSEKEMGDLAMLNYDPNFRKMANAGDIIIAGNNFGAGSSREQAVTCLIAKGVQFVIAGSFNATYKRNALNIGFRLIECPKIVEYLKSVIPKLQPTNRLNKKINLNFDKNLITLQNVPSHFKFRGWSKLENELLELGGLDKYILKSKN
tara:strand:- start:55188 stop:57107 length:1920 start_codon:yes stop_codon:yes gene_type:complete